MIYEWGELIAGLEAGEIDFTAELTATEDRRQIYLMTDAVAERSLKYMRIYGSAPLLVIAEGRLLRFAFLDGSTTFNSVSTLSDNEFESFFVDDYEAAYNMLKSGRIDAFIDDGIAEAAFDDYGDISAEDFFPVIYSPVSLATQNPAFAPVISVVQKALENGGLRYLTRLFSLLLRKQGTHLTTQLTRTNTATTRGSNTQSDLLS
jgi:hypothetical protein